MDTNGKPTGLWSTITQLIAYNGSAIPQLGAHDTSTEWKPSSSGPPRCVHTRWYVADTPGPAILGLPSSSKLGVIQLNCTIQFACKQEDTPNLPRRPTAKHKQAISNPCTPKTGSTVQTVTPSSPQLQQGPHCCLP